MFEPLLWFIIRISIRTIKAYYKCDGVQEIYSLLSAGNIFLFCVSSPDKTDIHDLFFTTDELSSYKKTVFT